jgi:hypothetical protein
MNASLFHPAATLFLAGLFVLTSCSEKKAPEASKAGTTSATAPKFTNLAEVPENVRQELDAFGRELEAELRAKNFKGAKAKFHLAGFSKLLVEGVNASPDLVEKSRKQMESGFRESLDRLVKTWAENDLKYKHLVIHDGQVKLRFRMASSNVGVSIMDFTVQKRPEGKLGLIDIYNHAVGTSMVDQGRQNALPLLMEMDRGLLDRMFGKSTGFSPKDIETFAEMTESFQKQNFKSVIASYRKLSPEMQRKTMPTVFHITALAQNQDMEGYKAALKEASKTQDSASFQFMLVDLYFLEGDHDKAIACLDAFMTAVEKDSALLALKGLILHSKGSTDAAREVFKEALALEADSYYTHEAGVPVLLAAKDHAAVAASMRFLEANGPHQFKGALTDAMWADFLKSPESAPWR